MKTKQAEHTADRVENIVAASHLQRPEVARSFRNRGFCYLCDSHTTRNLLFSGAKLQNISDIRKRFLKKITNHTVFHKKNLHDSEKSVNFAPRFRKYMPKKDEISIYNPQDESVVIYRSEDESVTLDVQLANETVWLTQKQMAWLFDKMPQNITIHIGNIYFYACAECTCMGRCFAAANSRANCQRE